MPSSQLYGKAATSQDEPASTYSAQPLTSGQTGAFTQGGGPQQANSPYANFEDIYNENSAYGAKAAQGLAHAVTDPLGGLAGHSPNGAYQNGLSGNQNAIGGLQQGVPGATLTGSNAQLNAKGMATDRNTTGEVHTPGYPATSAGGPSGKSAQTASGLGTSKTQAPLASITPQSLHAPGGLVNAQKASDLLQGFGGAEGGNQIRTGLGSVSALNGKGHVNDDNKGASPYEGGPGNNYGSTIGAKGVGQGVSLPNSTQLATDAQATGTDNNVNDDPNVIAAKAANDASQRNQNALPGAIATNAKDTATENSNEAKYTNAAKQLASYNGGDQGLALMQANGQPGADAWDAAIMNQGGGRSAFADLTKRYGDMDTVYGKQIGAAQDQRNQNIANMQTQQGMLGDTGAALTNATNTAQAGINQKETDAQNADNLAQQSQTDAQALAAQNAASNDPSKWGAGQWLRTIGDVADPVGGLINLAGTGNYDSPLSDAVTNGFEKWTGDPLGNTSHQTVADANTNASMPTDVSASMTAADWAAYNAMTPAQKVAFIQQREQQTGGTIGGKKPPGS